MGILLVYDVTQEQTFQNITNWLKQIEAHANVDVLKVLVANKTYLEQSRTVSRENGESLAK